MFARILPMADGASADALERGGALHRVVALALPGVVLLDLAAPIHLFGHCGAGRYEFEVVGLQAGPVRTSTGLDVIAVKGLEALAEADTVVVAGYEAAAVDPPDGSVLEAIQAVYARGGRVMSICVGAFALGHAGLLDGRRATTHWWSCERFAARFPKVAVDPDVLYVDEGRILTSAGVASGLDLCLHVIRRDHGAHVAAEIARRTVVAPHRDGGQAQFVVRPAAGARAAGLSATRAWALERIAEPLDVATLAAHASVSPRTFARRFVEETGTTPARWVLDQRVALAQQLLERTELPVEEVATQAGFGGAASLREHLARRAHTTPTAYRRAFRTSD